MNIHNFIDYKKVCPICNNDKLSLTFYSKNKQILHRNSDDLIGIFDLKGTKKGQSHFKFGIEINKLNNSFHINFYDDKMIDNQYQGNVPLFLIRRFKEYHSNINGHLRFYKECLICRAYTYQTNTFSIDLMSTHIDPIEIGWESWSFMYADKIHTYSIKINNDYLSETSDVYMSIVNGIGPIKDMILSKLPIIKFNTIEDAAKKIILLKTFS